MLLRREYADLALAIRGCHVGGAILLGASNGLFTLAEEGRLVQRPEIEIDLSDAMTQTHLFRAICEQIGFAFWAGVVLYYDWDNGLWLIGQGNDVAEIPGVQPPHDTDLEDVLHLAIRVLWGEANSEGA